MVDEKLKAVALIVPPCVVDAANMDERPLGMGIRIEHVIVVTRNTSNAYAQLAAESAEDVAAAQAVPADLV